MKAQRAGFTLIEMVVTIAIAGILAALAAPSFRDTIMNSRISSDASGLISDLALARSEAAKRGSAVSVCISSDGLTCTGTDWASGRLVFTDTGTVGTIDGTDTVLRVSGALTGNTLTSSDFTNTVTYAGTGVVAGFSSGTTGAFTVCRSGYIGRIISISVTGRVSTDKTGSNCS